MKKFEVLMPEHQGETHSFKVKRGDEVWECSVSRDIGADHLVDAIIAEVSSGMEQLQMTPLERVMQVGAETDMGRVEAVDRETNRVKVAGLWMSAGVMA